MSSAGPFPLSSRRVHNVSLTLSRLLGLPLTALVLHWGFVANESKCRSDQNARGTQTAQHEHHGGSPRLPTEPTHHSSHTRQCLSVARHSYRAPSQSVSAEPSR